ncbi:2,5-diketo-D-gluconate reductase A [Psychrobacillus sp. OK028]|uniref:aldo/keto reductase n=1 Tax=Psychrobacillus sp. OK028 TaxID=1884359 RepID=UPI00088744D7|nr:aldo/keto reductase [Psychrobacillus sp. OK028]SDN58957.1 2,5-diketo-D-gluconate reductase A [Psychrobacillus sp. OK028]
MEFLTLSNGLKIPQIGFGVWKVDNETEAPAAVAEALRVGYRHIDTAAVYKNEEGVAKGIIASGVPREDIFLTSKIWNDDIRSGRTKEAFHESLNRLQTDYLDLCLLHWPVEGIVEAWRALIELYEEGKIKAIGVSNFKEHHLDKLQEAGLMTPMVNQIELHPQLPQQEFVDYLSNKGIQIEAWSPLMQGKFMEIDLFHKLAEKYSKSPSQIVLRWHLQLGRIALPKSVTPSRIQENLDVFDFELSSEDMNAITALATNVRIGTDPDKI